MNSETELVINVWEAVSDVIPPAKRHDAAVRILRAMEEYGIDIADLSPVTDEDPLLAKAYAEVAPEDETVDADYDDE